MRKRVFIVVNGMTVLIEFILGITQGAIANSSVDENKSFNFMLMIKNPLFIGVAVFWILFNGICYSIKRREEEEEDIKIEERWAKNKGKLLDSATKKGINGDYSGAEETIRIIERLNEICEN